MNRGSDDQEEHDAISMAEHCYICDKSLTWERGFVLVQGRFREAHCSTKCLDENLRGRRRVIARRGRRVWVAVLALVVLVVGGKTLWRRYHLPETEWISTQSPGPLPEAPVPEPVRFGPAWPPSDSDWAMAFARSNWVHPLPGPNRRAGKADARIFPRSKEPRDLPAVCREENRCGVDVGGELWGEHVYAAHDGVVELVRANGTDEAGGQYVRLAHFGGMVFTQYFHLAAVPRGIVRGLRVKAGDLVGLLGDTGITSGKRHLHFTLSVRPSPAFAEIYWDPRAMMASWPMQRPANGSVAGYAAPDRSADVGRRRRVR